METELKVLELVKKMGIGTISSWVSLFISILGFLITFILFYRQTAVRMKVELKSFTGSLFYNFINKSWFDVNIHEIKLLAYQKKNFFFKNKREYIILDCYLSKDEEVYVMPKHRSQQELLSDSGHSSLFDKNYSDAIQEVCFDGEKTTYYKLIVTDFKNKKIKSNKIKIKKPLERMNIVVEK